jgi:hypothetical protein
VFESEVTCDEVDHVVEVVGISVPPGPSLGELDFVVDAFKYAVVEF